MSPSGCAHCGAKTARSDAHAWLCVDCCALVTADKSLSEYSGGIYNFCHTGLFELVEPDMRRRDRYPYPQNGAFCPLRERLQGPMVKLVSHLLWSVLWAGLLVVSSLFWIPLFCSLCLALSYATLLLFRRVLRATVLPSDWDRVVRLVKQGRLRAAEALTEQLGLMDHPGFLHNLAVGWSRRGRHDHARPFRDRANASLPELAMACFDGTRYN